jgi:hypothetical protein
VVVIVAILRPNDQDFPLFLHVLGAMLLFGSVAAVVIVGFAARRWREHAAVLARIAFRTSLFVVIPAWVLMRLAGGWIADKEFPDDTPGWVDVGFIVSEPGLIVVLALVIVAWLSARKGGIGRLAAATPILASIYLAALAIAVFAMSAKPGS